MEIITISSSTIILEDGVYHCDYGPAIKNRDGGERWYVKGKFLTNEEILLAKQILADPYLAPLYMNHPRLKYFCETALKKGPTHE